MARYKRIDTSPKFLPVVLSEQLLPGTFEHALYHLVDHELDLTGLDAGVWEPCPLRDQCLRHPERTPVRQVVFFTGKTDRPESHTERMKRKLDSEEGRRRYAQRFATVEPVFANIRHNKRLNRLTLRGRHKVDTQWKLFCLVHNIEKLAHHGYAQ